MTIESRIQSIKNKLAALRRLDSHNSIFGARHHKYVLNSALTANVIEEFENRNGIVLPKGYRAFLLLVGNGGAGPYYGLGSLQDSLSVGLNYKRENDLLDPSKPFEITGPWNMKRKSDQDIGSFEEEYFDDKWVNGVLRICHYGCGIYSNLVVNGPEYGNIWVDDRCNSGGIYPDPYFKKEGRIEFFDWYEAWLDLSLSKSLQLSGDMPNWLALRGYLLCQAIGAFVKELLRRIL